MADRVAANILIGGCLMPDPFAALTIEIPVAAVSGYRR